MIDMQWIDPIAARWCLPATTSSCESGGKLLYPSITAYWLTEFHSVTPCALYGASTPEWRNWHTRMV